MQLPPAAWPVLCGITNGIAFPCNLRRCHAKPACDVVRFERASDVKVPIPRVRFLHGKMVGQPRIETKQIGISFSIVVIRRLHSNFDSFRSHSHRSVYLQRRLVATQ